MSVSVNVARGPIMKSSNSKRIVKDLFSSAGIAINGKNPYDIQVHNDQFYQRVLAESSLGFGESYMDGWWDCEAIDQLICKMHKANVREKVKGNLKVILPVVKSKLVNLQTKTRAYEVGEKHYDIGNDLYERMLGKTMAYTSAYWKHANNLDEAQEAKMDLVCKKTNLKPGMTVLELGCGWGGFAKYAAEKYGVEVTGVTVSKEQVKLGNERCKGLPVEIKLDDYRNVKGQYDAVVSIGILEHVGYKNYRTYMEIVNRCLNDDGIAFAHTIGGNLSRTTIEPWIGKYIFPNAMLPSIAQLANAMEGIFVMEDWHNFGPDYDATLMAWYENFENAWPELKYTYGERFYRMWKFYLLSCAGGFRARYSQLWQIVMTKQEDHNLTVGLAKHNVAMIYSDVIIVGGGPAGATCAWKLKQKGIECIILDKNSFPREKVCAGWITPKVMKNLEMEKGQYPHTLVTFSRFHMHIYGKNPTIRTRQYAIRRYEFDDWLLKRSNAKTYQHHAKNIARDNGTYIIDDAYRCTYLIGAAGTYCPVYQLLFADVNPRAKKSYITAIEEEFAYPYKENNCHLWFFENGLPGYSWYVPKGDGYVNVGIGGAFERLKQRNSNIKKQWEHFRQKLEALSLINNHPFSPKGYNYYLRQNIQVAHRNNAYIIGDSAGLATKDLGEGIGPAVESAILAADSIYHGSSFSLRSVTTYSLPGIVFAGLRL